MGRLGRPLVAGCLFLAAVISVQAQQTCSLTQITNTTGNNLFNRNTEPAINAAGDRIAFASNFNLAGTNADSNFEIFLWDASTGFTQITNTSSGGNDAAAINAAGDRIAFESNADPLGSNSDGNIEIFLWDASTGLTQITNSTTGTNRVPAINAVGNRVTFASTANLLGSDADGSFEIFLWDASTGLTQITQNPRGSFAPTINAAGNRITFDSNANFTGGNSDFNFEIFLWDASTGISQVTNTSGGNSGIPVINATGNRIAFDSNVGSADGVTSQIFLWDSSTGVVQITNTAGRPSVLPTIDAAGNRVAFRSDANLAGSNGEGRTEIFLWDATSGFTQVTDTTSGFSDLPAINAAGNRIAFQSNANPLGSNGDGNTEIFLASCPGGAQVEVSIPAVSPLGLGILAVLLGLAAAWILRRRRELV
jgi:Tol biopolymer transport system component